MDAPNPTTDIRELEAAGLPLDDPKFEFHMMLLRDERFVESESNGGIGFSKSADGRIEWSVIPSRLTKPGHELAQAIGNRKVLQTLKKDFVGATISTIRDVEVTIFKAELAKHTRLQL